MNFTEQWLNAVETKNTVLCAGIDPAEFAMGRGDKGLPQGTNKADWAEQYMTAVGPYVAAFKPNGQFWQGAGDAEALKRISEIAAYWGVPVIQDRKLADIGDTNDAGIYAVAALSAQAVTLAPYAGNMKESQGFAQQRGISLITMCLMSNPEFAREKSKLVQVEDPSQFMETDRTSIDDTIYVQQYIRDAALAANSGVAGIVIGAPSAKNHITPEEIKTARLYSRPDTLVLMPGVGKQQGDETPVWEAFGADNVIVNVGTALMYADKPADVAKSYMDRFNEGRKKS